MKRLTILVFIASVSFLFAPGNVIGGPAGPPSGLDVTVVNQPTVDAKQSGNWSVTVENSNPIPVKDQHHDTCKPTIVHIQKLNQGVVNERYYHAELIEEVPEDQVLVIETVSVQVRLQDGLLPATVRFAAGYWDFMFIPLIESPGLSFNSTGPEYNAWSNTLSTRLYVTPGQPVYAQLWTDEPVPTQYFGIFEVSFWGKYIHKDCFYYE